MCQTDRRGHSPTGSSAASSTVRGLGARNGRPAPCCSHTDDSGPKRHAVKADLTHIQEYSGRRRKVHHERHRVPDRSPRPQAPGARNSGRLLAGIAPELVAGRHASATDALLGVLDVTAGLFRTEPGYRSVRVGDVLDLLPPQAETTANAAIADVVADALVAGYGVADTADTRRAVGTAVEVIDALVARAFARSAQGDTALLDEARRSVRAVLAGRL